jgi:predicted  nucleic acid-binding Zn-ribbon protein
MTDEERIADLEHQIGYLEEKLADTEHRLDKAGDGHDALVSELSTEQDNSADLQKQVDDLENIEKDLRGALEGIQRGVKDALR